MPLPIFPDKNKPPATDDLKKALGKTISLWNEIKDYTLKNNSGADELWNYSGKTYVWSCHIKDIKRILVYLMPCEGFFKISPVFGEKATQEAMKSKISNEIKDIISSAKVYAEGRGFRINVKNKKTVGDIIKLIDIKLKN